MLDTVCAPHTIDCLCMYSVVQRWRFLLLPLLLLENGKYHGDVVDLQSVRDKISLLKEVLSLPSEENREKKRQELKETTSAEKPDSFCVSISKYIFSIFFFYFVIVTVRQQAAFSFLFSLRTKFNCRQSFLLCLLASINILVHQPDKHK